MKFERFEILMLAVLAVPVLLMLAGSGFRRWKQRVASWGPSSGWKEGGKAPGERAYGLSLAFRALALVFVILALSRPIYGERTIDVQRKGVDLLLALDVSRSMLAADPAPSRLEWAKREVADLLGALPGARIGLVSFAGTAFLQCPFTVDRETLRLFLDHVSPEYLPVGGSSIADALTAAIDAFDPTSPADRAIILVSDGEATSPGLEDAAATAAQAGIRVFALGVGSIEGAPVPAQGGGFARDREGRIVVSKLGEASLELLARTTAGAYLRSRPDNLDTEALVKEIRAKLKEADLESGTRTIPEDRYQWFLGPALLFWVLGAFFHRTRSRRSPAGVVGIGFLAVSLAIFVAPVPAGAEPSFRQSVREAGKAYENGEFPVAARHYGEAAVARPGDPRPGFNRGVARYASGNYGEAAEDFEKITTSSAGEGLKEDSWYNLGNARFKAGDLEGSIKAYEQALGIKPDDQDARKNLEFVRQRLEEMQKQQSDKSQSSDDKKDQQGSKQQDGQSSPQQGTQDKGQADEAEGAASPQKDDASAGTRKSAAEPGTDGEGKENEPREQQGPDTKGQATGSQAEQTPQQDGNAAHDRDQSRGEVSRDDNEGAGKKTDDAAAAMFGGETGRRRAEALLEGLQDRPGTALLPVYKTREVEKDW